MEYASIHAAVSFVLTMSSSSLTSPNSDLLPGRTSMQVYPRRATPLKLTHISLQLTGEDSFQIATMGVQGLRVEIVGDSPPPPDEPP